MRFCSVPVSISTGLLFAGMVFALLITNVPAFAQYNAGFDTETRTVEGYGEITFVPGKVIVKIVGKDTQTPEAQSFWEATEADRDAQVDAVRQLVTARHFDDLPFIDAELWDLKSDQPLEEILRELSDHPLVEYAQPDIVYPLPEFNPIYLDEGSDEGDDSTSAGSGNSEASENSAARPMSGVIPNDTRFGDMWGMFNTGQSNGIAGADISATDAWAIGTGSRNVVIAILDSGIDYNHPDLNANMWTNENGNYGANFVEGSPTDPIDTNGHGTHVAGTVGAVGNNGLGVVGVMWEVSLMAVKVCGSGGCPQSSIVNGLNYAVSRGVKISNNSYGSPNPTSSGPPPAYRSMMQSAEEAGHLYVAASGNENNDNDILNVYPANLMKEYENVISVGNSTRLDQRANSSCYGDQTVHFFAPGSSILSTVPNGAYAFFGGTSMASPHVAGLAGLILSIYPDSDYKQIKDRMMDGADFVPSLNGLSITDGRINAFASLLNQNAVISVEMQDYDFSISNIGTSRTLSVPITNDAIAVDNLVVELLIEGSDRTNFSPGPGFEKFTVEPGETVNARIRYLPRSARPHTATLQIYHNSTAMDNPVEMQLLGESLEAEQVMRLEQNYPNPFNPVTTIPYVLAEPSEVTLEVFNSVGQRIAVLPAGEDVGRYAVPFDATNYPSGLYFYRLIVNGEAMTRKMLIVK
ncbi:MAG: hypothetical protein DA446_05125 [Bacteroidetes bacterium]|nr:MAG: hypothetical protein DA446_05125 [Bacteroidota bacterium]